MSEQLSIEEVDAYALQYLDEPLSQIALGETITL